MDLYRDIDIQAITDRIDTIVEDATREKLKKLRPTGETLTKIRGIIMEYVKENKRIIYGGTAYNQLIKAKNKKDAIYSDLEEPIKDVEFYSPDPVADMIALANTLKSHFEFVEAKEAMHNETFSVFVEFNGSCDISYMPKFIFNNMPKVVINDIYYTHPSFILVDILRQYNDPLTSYWRLKDKTFFRANMLIKHYPLDLAKGKPSLLQDDNNVNKFVFEKIIPIDSLIHIGSVAYNYFINPKQKTIDYSNPLVCYSTQIHKDAITCYDIIVKKFKKEVSVKEYVPFFQFLDRKVVFYVKDYPALTLIGSNNKCIPYNTVSLDDNKIKRIQLGGVFKDLKGGAKKESEPNSFKLGTFILLFMYLLMEMHYQYINRNKMEYTNVQRMMRALLEARLQYMKEKNITVVDKSPYQEFILNCSGNTQDQMMEARLRYTSRRKAGKMIILRYDPISDDANDNKFKINFNNTSGNLITNKSKLLIPQAFVESKGTMGRSRKGVVSDSNSSSLDV